MKEVDHNYVQLYKGRTLDATRPIRVYRNLTKKGKWYSVVQDKLTVAHTTAICLKDAKFVVNEKARVRVLAKKRKEFHAYVEGLYTTSGMGTTSKNNDLPAHIKYNPYLNETFVCDNLTQTPFKVSSARFVICNEDGVRAAHVN